MIIFLLGAVRFLWVPSSTEAANTAAQEDGAGAARYQGEEKADGNRGDKSPKPSADRHQIDGNVGSKAPEIVPE